MKLENYEETDQQKNKFLETLGDKDWLGEVVVNEDPLFIGRCKIRVFEKFDKLEDEDLPWVFPASSPDFAGGESKGYGSFSYPKLKTLVRVRFNGDDIYHPEYAVVENINEKLLSEIKESYVNSQIIRFDEDEDMKIYYLQSKGILIWLKGSYVNIDKDLHIHVFHVGGPSNQHFIDGHITLNADTDIISKSPYQYLDANNKVDVGHGADQSITRCESLLQLLQIMCTAIDGKVPTSPVATQAFNSLKSSICSSIGKVAP